MEQLTSIKGGYTNYGQDVGILMMRTVFPRLIGDIGNARTFSMPVRYQIVDVDPLNITEKNANERLIQPFIRAACELEAAGCKAIATSCGFLGGFQRQLADAVNIPVFTSTLLLAPMVHAVLNRNRSIGILTECAATMTESHFNQAGWSSRNIPVNVTGMSPDSAFSQLIIGDNPEGNWEQMAECIKDMTKRHMQQYPDTGALLLECTNYAPFTKMIQEIAQVPVFGMNQLLEYIDSCINAPDYHHI
ncbi:MAG: aspartate/glutamate racemase family protein [Alphaproteobacteria bacterium]|nr:aspartate/glutamate racemase family protein [Alphaproteobacteria bacterium]